MRIAKFTSAGHVALFALFLTGTLMGQEAKWERSIDKGDEAMANQHYEGRLSKTPLSDNESWIYFRLLADFPR